jgi:hypothetical protein
VILKIVAEAGYGMYTGENRLVAEKLRWKNRPVVDKKAGTEILMRLPKQHSEVVNVFKEAN